MPSPDRFRDLPKHRISIAIIHSDSTINTCRVERQYDHLRNIRKAGFSWFSCNSEFSRDPDGKPFRAFPELP
jgi:hypothetical protein